MLGFKNRSSAATFILLVFAISPVSVLAQAETTRLSLEHTLSEIKKNDFRLKQFESESKAYLTEAKAADFLPDPTVFAAIQSLPTDTFELDQEPMTQLRFGVRQMFPKGDTLDIKVDLANTKSGIQNWSQKARWLMLRRDAEQQWLDAWFWQKKLSLLEEDRVFLVQIVDFIRSLYEVGARSQSDLIGADLELIQLTEKMIEARREYSVYRQQLNTLANHELAGEQLSTDLPVLAVEGFSYDPLREQSIFYSHPNIEMLNQKLALAEKNVDLVQQDFEPAWGMEVSYGLRDGKNMDGSDRADFLYAGVNVQLPLFSKEKQQQNKSAAKHRAGSVLLERDEAVNALRFQYRSALTQHQNTLEQRRLYERDILPTLAKQKESALQSYEADKGDFRVVVSLYLKEQNAKSLYQRLRANEQKFLSTLNFLLGLDSGAFKE